MSRNIYTKTCFREFSETSCVAFKYGMVSFKLPGCPFKTKTGGTFSRRSSEKACLFGKLVILRVLEEMDKLGYTYMLSSDLTRTVDNGTMIFRKSPRVPVSRPWRKCLCVTPLDLDKLVLIRCPENVQEAVRFSIGKTWTKGITYAREETISSINSSTDSSSETIFKVKLKGKPWSCAWASNNDEAVGSRKLVIEIVKNLEGLGWKFYAEVNIKGTADSMFFVYDPESASQREEYGMLCVNRVDRLRLIDFDENPNVISTVIRSLVNDYRSKHPQTQEFNNGTTEFKLDGSPFLATEGKEVVESRLMIAGVLAGLRELGYQVVSGLNFSRKLSEDKTSILFRKQFGYQSGGEGNFILHACIAPFDENILHIINFPTDVRQALREVIEQYYPYGIHSETYLSPHCLQLTLNGRPWNDSLAGHTGRRTDNFHARSMMLLLLKKANRYGWELVLSADLSCRHKTGKIKGSSRKDHVLDVHSWFFCFHGVQYYYQSQPDYPPPYQPGSN